MDFDCIAGEPEQPLYTIQNYMCDIIRNTGLKEYIVYREGQSPETYTDHTFSSRNYLQLKNCIMKKLFCLLSATLCLVLISSAQKKYSLGLHPELGGYVFKVSDDGLHGLVAETKDIEGGWSWYAASEVVTLKCVHTPVGAKFSDWRIPTKDELNEMIAKSSSIGNFTMEPYWSATESDGDKTKAYCKDFSMPFQGETDKLNKIHVRAVRAF